MNDSISRGELLFCFFIFGMLLTMSFFSALVGFGLKSKPLLRYGLLNLGLIAFLSILNNDLLETDNISLSHRFIYYSLSGISFIVMLYMFGKFIHAHSQHDGIRPKEAEEIIISKPEAGFSDLLTERELEVLKLTAEGMTDKEIADVLHLSVPTIKTHLRNIYHKLQVRNRVEATLRYKKISGQWSGIHHQ